MPTPQCYRLVKGYCVTNVTARDIGQFHLRNLMFDALTVFWKPFGITDVSVHQRLRLLAIFDKVIHAKLH
jgi:L-rhamnose isomerase